MLTITFEIDGRRVSPGDFEDALERSILTAIEGKIRSRLTGLRDPETGEFPVVTIHGRSLDNLSIKVSGSQSFITQVKARLGVDDGTQEQPEDKRMETTPRAFLCHATEDEAIARPLAEKLQRNGIDTFYDKWEIGPGDSLRRKVEEGIGGCTHFIVLLTPISIKKPWVNEEIDAGFVRNLEGKCKFIPLRCGLDIDSLSPLLKGKHSPALDGSHDEGNIKKLINSIHGISDSPPLGEPPQVIQESSGGILGLSPAAEAIVRLMVESSEYGTNLDQPTRPDKLQENTQLNDDDLVNALDELEGQGFVKMLHAQGEGPLGCTHVLAEDVLFVAFDKYFKQWNPEEDALRIAADLVNGAESGQVPRMAEKYDWTPRRMNPAVNYLISHRLVIPSPERGSRPWCRWSIHKNNSTGRFVRGRS